MCKNCILKHISQLEVRKGGRDEKRPLPPKNIKKYDGCLFLIWEQMKIYRNNLFFYRITENVHGIKTVIWKAKGALPPFRNLIFQSIAVIT